MHDLLGVIDAREHHHFDVGLQFAQTFERFQTVDTGHQEVEQYKVGAQALLHKVERLLAGGGGLYLMIVDLEQRADVTQHAGFVVD